MNTVDVYIAALPQNAPIGRVKCEARQAEIDSASCERVKREKYFAWKLLCYALNKSEAFDVDSLNFMKNSYGVWTIDGAYFSISHSKNAIAVAVSEMPVGVDIEHVHATKSESLAGRIMNDGELSAFKKTPDEEKEKRLIEIWTAKEAIFKSKHLAAFIPKDHNTLCESFGTYSVEIEGEDYVVSVAADCPDKIRIFFSVDALF